MSWNFSVNLNMLIWCNFIKTHTLWEYILKSSFSFTYIHIRDRHFFFKKIVWVKNKNWFFFFKKRDIIFREKLVFKVRLECDLKLIVKELAAHQFRQYIREDWKSLGRWGLPLSLSLSHSLSLFFSLFLLVFSLSLSREMHVSFSLILI